MRLLHVSDLHLGRALGDLSREPEQRDLVGELIAAADELEVALTLISGDVFDSWSPPAWAEDLFFELLDGLAEIGRASCRERGWMSGEGVDVQITPAHVV